MRIPPNAPWDFTFSMLTQIVAKDNFSAKARPGVVAPGGNKCIQALLGKPAVAPGRKPAVASGRKPAVAPGGKPAVAAGGSGD